MQSKTDRVIRSISRIPADIQYNDTVGPSDPRYVDLSAGRGAFSYRQLFSELGLRHAELSNTPFSEITNCYHGMFLGHRGSGKSTELHNLCKKLSDAPCLVVFVDILSELNEQDFKYTDVILAIVRVLIDKIKHDHFVNDIPQAIIQPLENWTKEVENIVTKQTDISATLEAGGKAEYGLPFIASIFAKFTSSIKNSTNRKTEIREQVRSRFADLASAFMHLIRYVEEKTQKRVIFIIDGTDRLNPEDAQAFFQDDIGPFRNHLKSLFLYCANIILVHQQRPHGFQEVKLPMIKIEEKDGTPLPAGIGVLRQMMCARIDESLIAPDAVELLITYSGGHPRDLLRLISYSSAHAETQQISSNDVEKAAAQMASEYRRLLQDRYLPLIIAIDRAKPKEEPLPDTADLAHLVDNNLVLEYNDYWLKSHPCVRLLPSYNKHLQSVIDEENYAIRKRFMK